MSKQVIKAALEAMCCMRDMVAHPDNLAFIDKHISVPQAALAEPEQEPVAWSGYDLDAMTEAFERVIEAHHSNKHPFHNPVDSDARMALRILRGFVPAMKAYTAPTPRKPLTDEEIIEHFEAEVDTGLLSSFADGVRFAERAHGIGEQREP